MNPSKLPICLLQLFFFNECLCHDVNHSIKLSIVSMYIFNDDDVGLPKLLSTTVLALCF